MVAHDGELYLDGALGSRGASLKAPYADAPGTKGLRITGYADPSYIYNKNQGRAGFQFIGPSPVDARRPSAEMSFWLRS